jgi:hypothetical protein
MTTENQQIRFETGRHLHNDIPGMAHAQDRADFYPFSTEGCQVGLEFVDHQHIRPPQEILAMLHGDLWGQIRRIQGWIIIDA